jgi:hypothetical protein
MSFPAYTPKARVQKPAPHFSGTAVVDGTFEGTFLTSTLFQPPRLPLFIGYLQY